ncbi:ISLre2 family transposase [Hymenobacter elongatus]|uniref:ISLre2 family transposase n=1 Tax=Hymenobacter elongatus TaxID=877208 RepID=A0A4Z0PDY2_9BACT|nr:ISLre2 family transposase [Hymenobacter elongatus]
MTTRFGPIQIANSQAFSHHLNGFGISPYLQEKLVFLGQFEVYQQASALAETLLGLSVGASQIDRLTHFYGGAIADELDQAATPEAPETAPVGVVYAQADGAMLLTDEGYKEAKLGRIFAASALRTSVVEERGGHIASSVFVGHLGNAAAFGVKLAKQLDPYKDRGRDLVFISDGALWLRQLMEKTCPQATLILDIYHAMEHIGSAGKAFLGTGAAASGWFDEQRKLLLDSKLDEVLTNLNRLPIAPALRDSVCAYLRSNRDRMDYKTYRERGLLIGSGAIESAHRTVMQRRLKRAGQRWSTNGAQRVLTLRVCAMSNRWQLVRQHIEPFNTARAA